MPQDEGTRIAFKDIFLEDVYGLREITALPKTILDVGAHAGLFSLYARILFSDAVIHAYEPNPVMSPYLEHQARLGQFTVYNEGVGARSEAGRLAIGADSVFTQTVADSAGSVQITAFSEAVERIGGAVDLLKLDCEGCEWKVLEETDAMQKVGAITMEYHLGDDLRLESLHDRLKSLGLTISLSQPDGQTNGRIWAQRLAREHP
ncbi:MAG TPA: FkbM family methyltransferase [Chthoniobacterales bacterium]|nr:FkbM family methyltransferase [Chthoniobacterales bacterium]